MKPTPFCFTAAFIACSIHFASAADFGSFTGRFLYDGKPPAPVALNIANARDCADQKVPDESLVVGKEGGIANVVVRLFLEKNQAAPQADPDVLKTLPANVLCEHKSCCFTPRVFSLFANRQGLIVGNNERFAINVKSNSNKNSPFNRILKGEEDLQFEPEVFAEPEPFPVSLTDSIHPWMTAYVIVADHPFVGISAADGKFQISGIPAGKHTFRVWQERSGYLREVKQNGKETTWNKGLIEVEIQGGKTLDLGTISVSPKNWAER